MNVFHCAVRRAAPPWAAAMVPALLSTLLHGPSHTPSLAARTAVGDQQPCCSGSSPAGEVTVAPK
eukprot:4684745-Alexandrium_andersonii.AAC.1